MITDELSEFADDASLSTASTGLAVVGNVIDLGALGQDLGNGSLAYLCIQIVSGVTSTGSATLQLQLVSDAQYPIATDGTASVHVETNAIPVAQLSSGVEVAMVPLPLGLTRYERFLGILQNVGTAALTGGSINAFLTRDPQEWHAYPDGI